MGPNSIHDQPAPGRIQLVALAADRALALLTHAAENGNADAAYMLAMIYQHAAGVPRDLVVAARWLRRAAELDYDRVVLQLSRRCDDLLQHLLSHCNNLLQARKHGGGPFDLRRTIEELADSTHDLEIVAAIGRPEEQRDTA